MIPRPTPCAILRRAALAAVTAVLMLAPAEALAGGTPTGDPRCMERVRTFSLFTTTVSVAGSLIRGGEGPVRTGSGLACRGAAGDIDACWRAGRVYRPGAVATFRGADGLPIARICRLGVWD